MAGEEKEPNWMTPYKNFLIQRILPSDKDEAQSLKKKGQLVCQPQWRALQKTLDNTLTEVCGQPTGILRHARAT